MNARSRGPAPAFPSLLTTGGQQHAALCYALDQTINHLARSGVVDPLSYLVLSTVPPSAYVPCALLAWSKCRWNELVTIDLPGVIAGQPIRIEASKGSRPRTLPGWPLTLAPCWARVDPSAPLLIISYDAVCQRLAQARRRAGIELPAQAKDKTHIFRHLYASWLHAQGESLHVIAARLGHRSESSTRHYIHPLEHLKARQ